MSDSHPYCLVHDQPLDWCRPPHADLPLCEGVTGIGQPCPAPAAWLVAVGSRTSDAQHACARHLNSTCWLMLGNEMPRRDITLAVTPVRVVPLSPDRPPG